jgi:hypothetical protein
LGIDFFKIIKNMSEPLSSNAIIYAILSLNSEIALQKEYLDSSEISVEDRGNEEEILSDLEQAFMEFLDLYKSHTRKDRELPNIEELLNSEL